MIANEFTLNLHIKAPELSSALNNFADAMRGHPAAAVTASNTVEAEIPAPVGKPVEVPAATSVSVPTVAPATTVANGANNATTAAPASAPTEVTTPATTGDSEPKERNYTFDDITKGGAQLLEAGKIELLMNLLKSNYGVQAVTQLKPEQYASIAADLRTLGANI